MLVNLLGRSGKSFQLQYQVSPITDSSGTEKLFRNVNPFRVGSKLVLKLKTRSEFRPMLEPCRPVRSSMLHEPCSIHQQISDQRSGPRTEIGTGRCFLSGLAVHVYHQNILDCLLLVADQFQSFARIAKNKCGFGCL